MQIDYGLRLRTLHWRLRRHRSLRCASASRCCCRAIETLQRDRAQPDSGSAEQVTASVKAEMLVEAIHGIDLYPVRLRSHQCFIEIQNDTGNNYQRGQFAGLCL